MIQVLSPRSRGHLGLEKQTDHRAGAQTHSISIALATCHSSAVMSAQARATVPAGAQNPQEDETPFRKFISVAQVRITAPTYSQNFIFLVRC